MLRLCCVVVFSILLFASAAMAADAEKICESPDHIKACKDGVGLWNSEKPIHERNRITADAIKRDGAKYCERWEAEDEAKACVFGLAQGISADAYPY